MGALPLVYFYILEFQPKKSNVNSTIAHNILSNKDVYKFANLS